MERFFYRGTNYKIAKLAIALNEILNNELFLKYIETIPVFDMSRENDNTGITGKELVSILKTKVIKVNIVLYSPKWPWSKVNGYYQGGKDIFINRKRLWRSDTEVINTISHEYIHLIDNFLPDVYLGHGDNSPRGKEKTCPWLFGTYVESFYSRMLRLKAKKG